MPQSRQTIKVKIAEAFLKMSLSQRQLEFEEANEQERTDLQMNAHMADQLRAKGEICIIVLDQLYSLCFFERDS